MLYNGEALYNIVIFFIAQPHHDANSGSAIMKIILGFCINPSSSHDTAPTEWPPPQPLSQQPTVTGK
jgi:hypothetical protein